MNCGNLGVLAQDVPLSACRSAWEICSRQNLRIRVCCPPPALGACGQPLQNCDFVSRAGARFGGQTRWTDSEKPVHGRADDRGNVRVGRESEGGRTRRETRGEAIHQFAIF